MIADNGLPLVYKEFANINFSSARGKELKNLQLLLSKYKEWMYQLYPLNFEELTHKIETLSGNRLVQNELERLRNKRDGIADESNVFDFDNFDDNLDNTNKINGINNENMNNEFNTDNNNNNNNNTGNKNASMADMFEQQNNNNNKNNNENGLQNAINANIINGGDKNGNINDNNNNDYDANINDEMQDFDIDIETNLMEIPGEDEDELADQLFDEF